MKLLSGEGEGDGVEVDVTVTDVNPDEREIELDDSPVDEAEDGWGSVVNADVDDCVKDEGVLAEDSVVVGREVEYELVVKMLEDPKLIDVTVTEPSVLDSGIDVETLSDTDPRLDVEEIPDDCDDIVVLWGIGPKLEEIPEEVVADDDPEAPEDVLVLCGNGPRLDDDPGETVVEEGMTVDGTLNDETVDIGDGVTDEYPLDVVRGETLPVEVSVQSCHFGGTGIPVGLYP